MENQSINKTSSQDENSPTNNLKSKSGAFFKTNTSYLSHGSASTGSSTNSSRNASYSFLPHLDSKDTFDYNSVSESVFPALVFDKLSKKKRRTIQSSDLPSPGFDTPVQEENADKEDDLSHQILKRFHIVSDGEEFNEKKTRIRGREKKYASSLTRCRSQDTSKLPLHKVQEIKGEEDFPKMLFKPKIFLENFFDLNEFNKKEQVKPRKNDPLEIERSMSDKKYPRRFSLHINDKETIVEDLVMENKEVRELPLMFLSGPSSNTSSHHSSPRFKLKVDEIDLPTNSKKFLETFCMEEQEPILEATPAEEGKENNILQAAKLKLMREGEFLKKVIKSDFIEEADNIRSNLMDLDKEYTNLQNEPIQEEIEDEKAAGN